MMKNIILTGFMGTGKSLIGKELAQRLKMGFLDTDEMIEEEAGLSIPQIFSQFGERHFRKLEKKIIRQAIRFDNRVISTGGGAILDPENLKSFKAKGVLVCLSATPTAIIRRLNTKEIEKNYRPLIKGSNLKERIRELLAERAPYYAQADWTIDTTGQSSAEVANRIIKLLNTSTYTPEV